MNQIAITTMKAFTLGWGMVFLFVVFNSFGSMMIKTQVQSLGSWNFSTPQSIFSYFFTLFSSLKTWIGLAAVSIATASWIIALAKLELSKAYPVAVGLNLLVVVAISLIRFHEPLTICKMVGIFLVFTGVIFLFR